jgi:hypothetical protein
VITLETDVRIARPLEEVFAYVSEPLNFPDWNSAVQTVRNTSPAGTGVGSTYLMERELPTGRAVNELEVLTREWPSEFAIRTTFGPTPFLYRYGFSSENNETVVQLNAEIDLSGPAALLPQLARRGVKQGVDDNFAMLKRILEAPRR